MSPEAAALQTLRIRGRSLMALILTPEAPFDAWFAVLDQHRRASPLFFADRPIVVDLSLVLTALGQDAIPVVLEGLAARGLKLIGVDGARPSQLAGARWEELPTNLTGRHVARELDLTPAAAAEPAPPETPPPPSSLLIDRPVRSGQAIVHEEGDVIVIGAVASGAEVIAGGSIHVYGPLRGRAIAGLRHKGSRIFCRKLEAELLGVDQLFRTAEHWGPGLQGQAVEVRCDRGALRLTALA